MSNTTNSSADHSPRNNLTASRAPLVTDDVTQGYSRLSRWINSSGRSLYTCIDNTEGAAVWLCNAMNDALEIAKGNVSGHTAVTVVGRNIDIDAATEDIHDAGGTYVAPTAARVHAVASTSASDDGDPAGVGARTVRVYGLTAWTAEATSEDITLNGTSGVNTSNSYVLIHRMEVLTKGATGINVGDITATAATDSTVSAKILAGAGETQMAIYGLPSTQTLYVSRWWGSINRSGGATSGGVDVALLCNPTADAELLNFRTIATQGLLYTGGSHRESMQEPPVVIAGPAIVKLTGIGSAANNDVSAGFSGILVTN